MRSREKRKLIIIVGGVQNKTCSSRFGNYDLLRYHHLGSWGCHHYSRRSRLEASVSALNYLALKTAGSTGTAKDGGWATWHVVSDAICSCSLKMCRGKGIWAFGVSKPTKLSSMRRRDASEAAELELRKVSSRREVAKGWDLTLFMASPALCIARKGPQ